MSLNWQVNDIYYRWCPGGLEPSAPGLWAQGQDGLTRACPVVVTHVVPPLRRSSFLFHVSSSQLAGDVEDRTSLLFKASAGAMAVRVQELLSIPSLLSRSMQSQIDVDLHFNLL